MLYLGKVSLDYNGRGMEGKEEIVGCKTLEENSLLYIVKHKL